jgi:hypothetical protein
MPSKRKRICVTFAQAYKRFVADADPGAENIFSRWENRQDLVKAGVVDFVKSFQHERLFAITRAEFDKVVKDTQHPLGRIDPKVERDLQGIRTVESASTPWSFMQLFHDYVERYGLPTWQQFREWLTGPRRDALWGPYEEQSGFLDADREKSTLIRIGMAWRLGNAYYSALREVDILITFGDAGFPVLYHLLPDALFAVDLWRYNRFASVYIPNAQFKSIEGAGRKVRPETIYSRPDFYCQDFPIQKQAVHGKYWPVAGTTIAKIAIFLSSPESDLSS